MEILQQNSFYPTEVALILGFFDGVHIGHKDVILSAVDFAKKNSKKSLLITFNPSPAEYFSRNTELIFERVYSYKLIENLGVDYLLELDFTKIAEISAIDYLQNFLIKNFKPISISTGFNHSFGLKRQGNSDFLENYSKIFNYEYFCIPAKILNNEVVSSSIIKEYLRNGDVESANDFLGRCFSISSTVIEGKQLGREIGFPTANLEYPQNIVKLPYGVYAVEVLNKKGVLNWGVKPTVVVDKPVLEVHILDEKIDLYGKNINIKFMKRIRDEKKFNSLIDLKQQITKDIEECLKL